MASKTQDMLAHEPSKETREFLARRPVEQRTTIHRAHRRPFGLDPDALLAAMSMAALVLAIVLFAAGIWIGGVIILATALTSGALLVGAVRHEPTSRTSRGARRALTGAAGFAGFAVEAGWTWGRTLVSLAGITRQRNRLRRELQGQLAPLGEAAYREDHEQTERLKAQAARLDQAVGEADRQAAAVLQRTREKLRSERATVQPTETLPPLKP